MLLSYISSADNFQRLIPLFSLLTYPAIKKSGKHAVSATKSMRIDLISYLQSSTPKEETNRFVIRRAAVVIVVKMLHSKTVARMNGYSGFGACGSGWKSSESAFAGAVLVAIDEERITQQLKNTSSKKCGCLVDERDVTSRLF